MKQGRRWVVAAGLIAALELVFSAVPWIERLTEDRTRNLGSGVTVTVPSELGSIYGDILFSAMVGLAGVAIIAGLYLLNRQPPWAPVLILMGLAPATVAGAVFFWFPLMWLVTALAIVAVVGVARERADAAVAT